MLRPDCLVVIAGTGTGVGKTWVGSGLIGRLRLGDRRVAARKPVQSFGPESADSTDADILAAVSGEAPFEVCPMHRWYPRPMAPPMAAEVLGRPRWTLHDLVQELAWPAGIDVGVVETAGGLRTPMADDGDNIDLIAALAPDHVVLVADAGLGTINVLRLSLDAMAGRPVIVYLNGLNEADELHRRNREWIELRMGVELSTGLGGLVERIIPS